MDARTYTNKQTKISSLFYFLCFLFSPLPPFFVLKKESTMTRKQRKRNECSPLDMLMWFVSLWRRWTGSTVTHPGVTTTTSADENGENGNLDKSHVGEGCDKDALTTVISIIPRSPSYHHHRTEEEEMIAKRQGKLVIVTGGSSGIGRATCMSLAIEGYHVIVAGRDETKCKYVADTIANKTSNPQVYGFHLDLCSFESVRRFAGQVEQLKKPVHILIHNAGVMKRTYDLTQDRHEVTFQTNVLSPYLLTRLLFKRVQSSVIEDGGEPGKIIFVSCRAHAYGDLNLLDLESTHYLKDALKKTTSAGVTTAAAATTITSTTIQGWEMDLGKAESYRLYANSKLAMTMLAKQFQRDIATILDQQTLVLMANPGTTNTTLDASVVTLASHLIKPLTKTPEGGALTIMCLVTTPADKLKRGGYYTDCELSGLSSLAENVAQAYHLRDIADKLLNLSPLEDTVFA